jgi:glycerol kinase
MGSNYYFENVEICRSGASSQLKKDELMKLKSSDVLNLVTSKLQNTTGVRFVPSSTSRETPYS